MKKIFLLAILFPMYCYAGDLNLNVQMDNNTTSKYVNIITVDDTSFDTNGASQSLIMFTDNGTVYYSVQPGRSCNYKSGKTDVEVKEKTLVIRPNSSCNDGN